MICKRPVISFDLWNVILCHLLNIQKHTLPSANANPVTAEVHVFARTVIPLKPVRFVIFIFEKSVSVILQIQLPYVCAQMESDGLCWADLGQWGGTDSQRL